MQKIVLAAPRGYCAGVKRAIGILDQCLEKFSAPIFCNHEIVHNKFVVEDFERRGVVFGKNLDEIPEKSVLVFSAHGVSPEFRKQALELNLKVIDATCPLVSKVHMEAERCKKNNFEVIYIGKKNHQEALGVTAIVSEMKVIENLNDASDLDIDFYKNKKVAVLSQTTLVLSEVKKIFQEILEKIPQAQFFSDVCFATQNRQEAVTQVAQKVDGMIIVGSENSSNSRKLAQVAGEFCESVLCENVNFIPEKFFEFKKVGVSSGASVPEVLVSKVIEKFQKKNPEILIEVFEGREEKMEFDLAKFS